MKRLLNLVIVILSLYQVALTQTIAVQGVLRDPAGRTVVDGSHTVVFKLYDAETDGSELWSETHGSVPTSHGVFSETLGLTSSLATLSFTDPYWLGIQVDDGTEISQRMKLQSSPSANAVTGSSNIVPSTGNVGIGTLNPQSQLDVAGAGVQRINISSSDDQAGISFESEGSGAFVIYSPASSDDLHFYNGSQDVAALTSEGNLGIGVTEPQSRLHVGGSSYFEDRLRLMRESGANYLDFNNAQDLHLRSLSTDDSDPNQVMTVQPAGNIGVGTTTPSEKLEVAGNVKLSSGGAIIFSDGSSLASADLGGTAASVAHTAHAMITADTDDTDGGEIQFRTGSSTDMVITNDGYVGIGLTVPTHRFEVQGTSYFRDRVMLMRESGPNYIDFNEAQKFFFRSITTDDSSGTVRLTMDTNGYLGLGIDSPTAAFELRNSAPYIRFNDSDGGSKWDIGNYGGSRFILQEDGTERLVVREGGNIGINESNPTALLTIDAAGDGDVLKIKTAHSSDSNIFQVMQSSSDGLVRVNNANGETQTQLSGYEGTPSYFLSSVGIGTTSPGSKLDIKDDNGGYIAINPGDGNLEIASGNDGTAFLDFKGNSELGSDYEARLSFQSGTGINVEPGGTFDVDGRITRHGHAMSASGYTGDATLITAPWGTRDDWNLFVSIREMGIDETGSLGDNAMMMIQCYSYADGGSDNKWGVSARFLYRHSADHSSAFWVSGEANYLLVAK